jgi:pantoate--beta-alanine ligase
MRTVRTVSELRAALGEPRRAGRSIALVPTMGAFHDGHRALMLRGRALCDVLVVSLFVNPTQFGEHEDLGGYPRDEARDAEIAAASGADLLFAPGVADVYPDGFATEVNVDGGLTEHLCGAARGPSHFAGVATVVLKLLNMVGPDVAIFGQKDAQQAAVIQRMVRDLDLPVRIELYPIVRESDGLAMSSRNAYLSAAERTRALALKHALDAAQQRVEAGELDAGLLASAASAAMRAGAVEPEYVELVDPQTMQPVSSVDGETLLAVAARVGAARLIDNAVLRGPAHQSTSSPSSPPSPAPQFP